MNTYFSTNSVVLNKLLHLYVVEVIYGEKIKTRDQVLVAFNCNYLYTEIKCT